MLDLGIQIIGPVAQEVMSAYDDVWNGADKIHCEDFHMAACSPFEDAKFGTSP